MGTALLRALRRQTTRPVLIGTWAAGDWAVKFYEKHGFSVIRDVEEKNRLLRTYWCDPPGPLLAQLEPRLSGASRSESQCCWRQVCGGARCGHAAAVRCLWKAMLTAEVRCAGTLNDPASEHRQKQMAASVVLADAPWLQGPRPSGQPGEE